MVDALESRLERMGHAVELHGDEFLVAGFEQHE